MAKHKYKRIKLKNGKTRDEHRLVMEAHLGRDLLYTECVHHKDGNPRNNDISNLEVMSHADHLKLHRKEHARVVWTPERRQAYSVMLRREGNPNSKITESMAVAIKQDIADGGKNRDIASKYGISSCMVSLIRRGHRWA